MPVEIVKKLIILSFKINSQKINGIKENIKINLITSDKPSRKLIMNKENLFIFFTVKKLL